MKGFVRHSRRLASGDARFILTNGQIGFFVTGVPFGGRGNLYSKIDYFSNRLWERLDQPRSFLTLLRFERKYINKKLNARSKN